MIPSLSPPDRRDIRQRRPPVVVPEEDRAVQECQHPELSHQVRLSGRGDIIPNKEWGYLTHTLRCSYTKQDETVEPDAKSSYIWVKQRKWDRRSERAAVAPQMCFIWTSSVWTVKSEVTWTSVYVQQKWYFYLFMYIYIMQRIAKQSYVQ